MRRLSSSRRLFFCHGEGGPHVLSQVFAIDRANDETGNTSDRQNRPKIFFHRTWHNTRRRQAAGAEAFFDQHAFAEFSGTANHSFFRCVISTVSDHHHIGDRSEEHTSELQSRFGISYAV